MRVIVTGASKGIGRAIAKRLNANGADLAICSRNIDDLTALRTELIADRPGADILIGAADLSQKSDVLAFADLVQNAWPAFDVLINNAGVFLSGMVHQEPEGRLEKQIETNLYSAYHLTRALLPTMLRANRGHIINMCSIASLFAYPNGGSYSISKFALLGFSKVLRAELLDKNIKVTAILPGATWSNSWAGVDLPHERIMEADDVAKVVWNAIELGPSAVMEEVILRPQLGDL